MGVMSREIKKLRGRKTYVRDYLDSLSDAQLSRAVEDSNQQYLKQLYFGIETLIERIQYQEQMIEQLVERVNNGSRPQVIALRKQDVEYSKAMRLIRENKDKSGRIAWRKVDDPMELVFAYIMKMERDGVNIHKTTQLQEVPEYRRVFQYVAYNVGSWKNVIEEYENRKKYCGGKQKS